MSAELGTFVPAAVSLTTGAVVGLLLAVRIIRRRRRLARVGRRPLTLRERLGRGLSRVRRGAAKLVEIVRRFTSGRGRGIELARDAFVLAGIVCITRGTFLIYPPAAWIVFGTILFALGVASSVRRRKESGE